MYRPIILLAAVALTLGITSHVMAQQDPNLIGWWPLDEGSGTVVHDSSGHGYDGTVTNAAWTSGLLGSALDFNGGGYVDLPPQAWATISRQLTVTFWSYGAARNPVGEFTFGAFLDAADNNARVASAHVPWSDGTIYWDTCGIKGSWNVDRINKAAQPTDYKGDWRHWTFVKNVDTGVQSIYLNGVLWHSATGMTKVIQGKDVTAFSIGNRPAHDYPYAGVLDDFRLYNRALTDAQIKVLAARPKAYGPNPADGATAVTMPLLQWTAGTVALFHDVYLGTTPKLTAADLKGPHQPVAMFYYVQGLQPGTTYYWRVDEIDAAGAVTTGEVWSFTMMPVVAWQPVPPNGAGYMKLSTTLAWTAGQNALNHDVYVSSNKDDVTKGAAGAFKGNQKTPSLPLDNLTPATTYYWRVDEVGMTGAKQAGDVWKFTTRPVIVKADPNLAGWWKLDDEKSGLAADYSGYDNYGTLGGSPKFVPGYLGDALSFNGASDFVNCGVSNSLNKVDSVSVAAWVRLNRVGIDQKIASNQSGAGYKLGVYSSNNMFEFEIRTAANAAFLNRTAPGGTALQTNTWYHVVGVYEKGKALRTYVNGKLDRELLTAEVAGVSPGAFMLGREAPAGAYWWNGLMDDVRVYNKALTAAEIQKVMQGDPALAFAPQPTSGANVDIHSATALSWSAGEKATKHDVYLGTDRDAVRAADTTSPLYKGRQAGTSFSLVGLVEFGGGSYFWRIDEVEADGTTIHKGVIWSFTVPAYLIVDEFEGYTDQAGSEIFSAWIDGFADNYKSSGSTVGFQTATNGTFGETTIVHSGKQSMPMDYDNSNSPFYSEAVQTFAPLQDWTGNGVTDLSLWVRGNPALTSVAVTETAGKISLTGSGTDIWNNSDQFTFAYKTLTGDGSIVARVVSNGTGSNTWAKGGVMIRDSLDGGSTFANTVLTGGGGNGASFQYRLTTNGGCGNADSSSIITVPYWVKIERVGDNLNGYLSADGKTWRPQGTFQTIAMTAPVYIGICVTSHAGTEQRTFQFDSIATTGNVSGAWQGVAISAPQHNSAQPMYVIVEDSAGKSATATNATAANATAWTEWKIPLSSLTGVNLAKVKKVYIGVGDKKNPAADGGGRIYIDDIRVVKP